MSSVVYSALTDQSMGTLLKLYEDNGVITRKMVENSLGPRYLIEVNKAA